MDSSHDDALAQLDLDLRDVRRAISALDDALPVRRLTTTLARPFLREARRSVYAACHNLDEARGMLAPDEPSPEPVPDKTILLELAEWWAEWESGL